MRTNCYVSCSFCDDTIKILFDDAKPVESSKPLAYSSVSRGITGSTVVCVECIERLYQKNLKTPRPSPTPADVADSVFSIWLEYAASMPYEEYLQTQHWREFRAAYIESVSGKCGLCDQPGRDVHHRHYKRRGRETFADVILLCRDCHSRFHGKG